VDDVQFRSGLSCESRGALDGFHFGHHRRGNVPLLRELGARDGFDVLPVPLIARADGVEEPVSSTAVRRALAGGEVDIAAHLLGRPYEVRGIVVRSRSIGDAIVKAAMDTNADLIVLGSAPRWRRQSRFFSPTVDYVLKKAPSEVLIVAFPQGVLEEEVAPA